jgi:hypothetical protein
VQLSAAAPSDRVLGSGSIFAFAAQISIGTLIVVQKPLCMRSAPATHCGRRREALRSLIAQVSHRTKPRGTDSIVRHSLPLHRRAVLALRRCLNQALELLRTPFRRPHVLLVAGGASTTKTLEVEARLRFLLEHLERPPTLRTVQKASASDYLFSAAVASAEVTAFTKATRLVLNWVADLDYETNPVDGRALADLGVALNRNAPRQPVRLVRQTFANHIDQLRAGGSRPVYLFGTGPSLQTARERSFADGIAVVCNTIVRDAELWHHLAPAFLAAGDAIYHFGHTPHARAFRADALRRLQESEGRTLFVYPSRFDVIVRAEFRDIQSLLIPIPLGNHTDITVDLTKHFLLPKLGNVLNTLLLPLGCTLSKDVRLWGFDGRAPKDVGFWANSDQHSYSELMQSIRDAHPAFFAKLVPQGNEIQYVKQFHGDLLDQRLADAERRGFQFRMLHSTWTPTLQKRYRELCPDQE